MRGLSRYPGSAEIYIARALCRISFIALPKAFCGTVIVNDRGIPLSLGYNENPVGMKPCEL